MLCVLVMPQYSPIWGVKLILDTLTDWLTAVKNSDLASNLRRRPDGVELRLITSSSNDLIYEFMPLSAKLVGFSAALKPRSSYRLVLRFYSSWGITGDDMVDVPIKWLSWYRKGDRIFFTVTRFPVFRVDADKIVNGNLSGPELGQLKKTVRALPGIPDSDDLSRWLPAISTDLIGRYRRLVARSIGNTVKSGYNRYPPSTKRKSPEITSRLSEHVSFSTDFATGNVSKRVFPSATIVEYERHYASETTPNFKRLKRSQLPVNNYSLSIQKSNDNFSHAWTRNPSFRVDTFLGNSIWTYFTPLSVPFDSSLRSRCISKLIDRAHKGIDGNIAQDLAQYHQLQHLIVGPSRTSSRGDLPIGGVVGRIRDALNLVKSKNFVSAAIQLTKDGDIRRKVINSASVHKTTAQNWLAFQYAWKPLLQDIEALMQLLADYVVGEPVVSRVSARTYKDTGFKIINHDPIIVGGSKPMIKYREIQQCTAVLRYTFDNRFQTYVQRMGFLNPINLAWEVLPYSFVADWFLPIGPYLSSLSAWQGLSLKDGRITQFLSLNQASEFEGEVGPTFGAFNGVRASYSKRDIVVSREKLTEFPFLSPPRFKNGFSFEHSINGIALLVSAFSKR